MKNLCVGTILLFFGVIIGSGVSIAKDLPGNTPDRVVASVQSLVKAGFADDRSIEMTNAMIENHFTEDQIITVHRIMMTSMAEDLPTLPLTGKILEGVSKNIQPDRIVEAVKKIQARQLFSLSQGKQISSDRSEIGNLAETYAASLSAGLTKDDAKLITGVLIQTTASLNSENTYDLSMATLKTARDMSRLGVNSNTLAEVISSALNRGFSTSRIDSMRQSFISQAHQTQPNSLAKNYARAIDQGFNFGNSSYGNRANHGKSGQGDNADLSGGHGGPGGGIGDGSGDSGGGPGSGGSGIGGDSDGSGAGGGSDGSGSGSGDSGAGGASGGSGGGSGSGGSAGSSGAGSSSGGGSGGSSGGSGSGGSGSGD